MNEAIAISKQEYGELLASREELRDRFAMAALTGLIADGDRGVASDGSWTFPSLRSKIAYEYADAMLLARKARK